MTNSNLDGLCADRVAIITGAGRGIGRSHAIAFAREGARVAVNDISADAADAVRDEILAMGGQATSSCDDISSWEGAERLIRSAIDGLGGLHVVVNNAGNLRDRMMVNMSLDEWQAVMRVHLDGAFLTSRHAAAYWRDQAKVGARVGGRIINTSSSSGLFGNVGQTNYGAAKAGIAAFTIIAAEELARYGVTVNAIAPYALTEMTSDASRARIEEETAAKGYNPYDPSFISPLVVWLGSAQSSAITGRVFNVRGGYINVAEGWASGPEIEKQGGAWAPAELGTVIPDLVARAAPNANAYGERPPIDSRKRA